METSVINSPDLHFPLRYDSNNHSHSFLSQSHSSSFLFREESDSPEFQISDIEMITFQSVTYTSLKDLISTPSTATMSSSTTHNWSWNEIPIKNPLVKQAALAYLLPMETPPEIGNKGFLEKLRENGFGCLGWFSDAVLKTAKDIFGGISHDRKDAIEDAKEEEEKMKGKRKRRFDLTNGVRDEREESHGHHDW